MPRTMMNPNTMQRINRRFTIGDTSTSKIPHAPNQMNIEANKRIHPSNPSRSGGDGPGTICLRARTSGDVGEEDGGVGVEESVDRVDGVCDDDDEAE